LPTLWHPKNESILLSTAIEVARKIAKYKKVRSIFMASNNEAEKNESARMAEVNYDFFLRWHFY